MTTYVTTPTPAHRQHPKTNIGRHYQALEKKANRLKRQEASVLKSREQLRTEGMKQSLYRFRRNPNGTNTPWDNTIQLDAIDLETGEVRTYYTTDLETLRYIGNTDYLAYGKKPTLFQTFIWRHEDEFGHHLIDRRTAAGA